MDSVSNNVNLVEIDKIVNDAVARIIQDIQDIKLDGRHGLADRTQKLNELNDTSAMWTKTLEKINTAIAVEKKVLEEELLKEEERIKQIKQSLNQKSESKSQSKNSSWADIVEKETPPAVKILEKKNAEENNKNQAKRPSSYEIAPGVPLPGGAFEIENEKDCHNYLGWWCWCPKTKRFHISVNGFILSAITTDIIPSNQQPIKFHEHKACVEGKVCSIDYKATDFWVKCNPNDVQQLTNRMKFVPASTTPAPNDKYIYTIGSRDTLKEDLAAAKNHDMRLVENIGGSFMLINTAIQKEKQRRKGY